MKSDETKTVAAYCRVSTDSDDQANSFESQKRFFRKYIDENPDWNLYEIYADSGITGTNTKKRKAFLQMIEDARAGKFDLILTKEISRFARNLLDSIYYTRELKHMGVGIIFLSDNIDTRDSDAELRLAILSSIAQEESRRTSERVKWGQKRRMEDGVVFGHSLLGYDLKNGALYINESGADVIRFIFGAFLDEKKRVSDIARELTARGIKPKKAELWSPSVIVRILKNEKYCGDLIQKKTMTPDYLSHEKKYNHGEEAFVILRDHHEAIISRERFDAVQALLSERKREKKTEKFSDRYPFSGKIRCGICGKRMSARVQERKSGTYHLWRCGGHHISTTVKNEDVSEMLRLLMKACENELAEVKHAVMKKLSGLSLEVSEEKAKEAKQKLLALYLAGEIEKEEYLMAKETYAEQKNAVKESELDALFYDECFFREITEEIKLYENRAEIRLFGSSEIYRFDLIRIGRKREIMLRK